MIVPIWIVIGFQQRDRQDLQILNNFTFCRLPVNSAQSVIGNENFPDADIKLIYDDENYSQGFGQSEETFTAVTKDDIIQPYISDQDFRSSNVGVDDIG